MSRNVVIEQIEPVQKLLKTFRLPPSLSAIALGTLFATILAAAPASAQRADDSYKGPAPPSSFGTQTGQQPAPAPRRESGGPAPSGGGGGASAEGGLRGTVRQ